MRERTVLQFIAEGLSYKETALEMVLRTHTIHSHIFSGCLMKAQ
ncbi:MAG: hypothetical protein JXR25_09385 [Pontiellaceae bacterium]|nr:hypothetical protein [Pontiellaceae bacterium]MBN2785028.1 hypothetical protein [Pontiellaceae bacterium]